MKDSRSRGDASAEAAEMAHATDPADEQLVAAIRRAKAHVEEGDLEGGLGAFREIAESNPRIPEVFNNLGAICAAMGRREEAEQAFSRAVELTPENANPWYNRGLMRFQGGNNVGALEDFRRAIDLDPADAEVRNNLGVVLFQLRQWDEARAAFESSLDLRPGYAAARLNLIDVALAERRIDEACRDCRSLADEIEAPEVQAKLIECSVVAAVDRLDQAMHEGARQAELGELDLGETLARVARAKRVLLGQEPVAAPATPDDGAESPVESLLG